MKKTIIVLMLVVLFLGCTQEERPRAPSLDVETSCEGNEDLCILGTPGLLNRDTIYSGSDTFFSLILRNNLEGQESNNVKVQLKNVGPFRIVEGYTTYDDEEGVCQLEIGVWKPHDVRDIFNSPNPQFVDDLGEPFAIHMLDVMYPDEEVEFQWRLRSPDYQEIADVAYEHEFDYLVSYDYKSGLLQTIYALSEEEYQRQLSLTGTEPSTTGVTTPSIGALHISSNVDEPVRVQGNNSQFAITYEIYNQRNGLPIAPALFLLQYPEGVRNVGTFIGPKTLDEYGYIDLYAAVNYYNTLGVGLDGGVCLPEEFDVYSDLLENARKDSKGVDYVGNPASCSNSFSSVSLDTIFAYIRENFPDITFDVDAPRFVIKFLYPQDLTDETNYLYYQMATTEAVDISKYYTFRLKTKYRYSFTGDDEIMVVPNPASFESTVATSNIGVLWGDMNPSFTKLASPNYSLDGDTLTMTRDDLTLTSTIKDLRSDEFRFLHLIGLTTDTSDQSLSCTVDADCGVNYCMEEVCKSCIGEECTTITNPPYYTVKVGYHTLESHVNTILGTGGESYFLSIGEVLYFFDEIDYSEAETTVPNRANPDNHNINLENPTLEQASEAVAEFITRKCFFEVSGAEGLLLGDNDDTGFYVDYVQYQSRETEIPSSMHVLSYYDNESAFHIKVGSNEIIGVYSSPLNDVISDTLILYFFNNDNKAHYFEYNISLLNASSAVTGDIIVNKNTAIIADTNKYNSLDDSDYPYTKKAAANSVIRSIIELGDQTDTVDCSMNSAGVKPILIIDYDDYEVVPLTGAFSSSYNSGSIIIGDYEDLNALSSALGTSFRAGMPVVKGVVNLCYKTSLI